MTMGVCVCLQGVLREALEEVKKFFLLNSSCRLPLNPAMVATGIKIQVKTHTLVEMLIDTPTDT